ncbi:hypothetical protein LDO32_17275 [Luteimonas sp. Y-2-2-4F]|nr:polymorphic toxin type 46 domain-containing protein [Luteimonas sp. Y-2-2-4F]MCD9033468.1 hypothetical protein [Luteimonas sp. Y-2-2-4F]
MDILNGIKDAAGSAAGWVGDRYNDVKDLKSSVGTAIDEAVGGAKRHIDGFQQDIVRFGEEHGGIVGKTLAQGLSFQIGTTQGVVFGAYDLTKGVVQLADGAGQLVSPLEWAFNPQGNLDRLGAVANTGVALGSLASPVGWIANTEGNLQTAGALWNGMTEGYRAAVREGDAGEFVGRLALDVGSTLVGVGGANAAARGAQGASALTRAGEAANAIDKAGDAARILDDAADAGRAARGGDAGADATRAIAAAPDRPALPPGPERPALPAPEPRRMLEPAPSAATIAERQQIALDFYRANSRNPDAVTASHLDGIDFTRPVDVVTVPKGTTVYQWQSPGAPQGAYYSPTAVARPDDLGIFDKGVTPEAFQRVREIRGGTSSIWDPISGQTRTVPGIAEVGPAAIADKKLTAYVLQEDVQVLRSTARPVNDTWSLPDGSLSAPTSGGRLQYYNPDASKFLRVPD